MIMIDVGKQINPQQQQKQKNKNKNLPCRYGKNLYQNEKYSLYWYDRCKIIIIICDNIMIWCNSIQIL